MRAIRVATLSLPTGDLDGAIAFYTRALGFTVAARRTLAGEGFARITGLRGATARAATLRLGREQVELVEFSDRGAFYPPGSTSPDLWFQHFAIVVSDMDAAAARLEREGGSTAISDNGPQQLPASSGGVRAYKFRDPDGHPLELLVFPPDGAPAKWSSDATRRAVTGMPFLGIDHSAIAVADTARSEAFYAGLLGFTVANRSVNRGVEQEHLDGTFNALVEVTALVPTDKAGPHVELLCNRVPSTGRPIPIDTRPNDVAATRLVIEVDDLAILVDQARAERLRFVSPGIVIGEEGRPEALLHDPDGHLLQFVQAE